MDPATMMMIASAASSLLGGMGKDKGEDGGQQQANPFQQKQAIPLPGFQSMTSPMYQAALQKLLQ